MLVLILGDLHLPLRASSLPLKFRKLLVPGKIQQIVCTGNVCDRETWEYLRTIAPDVKGVKGDFDESPHLPPTLTINHSPIRLGVIHGHQILPLGDADLLNSLATTMDVDVLVSGATHRFEAYESDGRFFVNPGSATGAWCSLWPLTAGGGGAAATQATAASAATAQNTTPSTQGATRDAAAASGKGDASASDADANKGVEGAGAGANAADAAAAATPSASDKKSANADADADAKSKAAADDQRKSTSSSSPPPPPSSPPTAHPDPTPSFVLLDIQGSTVMCYVYQLIAGEVKVEKIEYRKALGGVGANGSNAGSSAAATAAVTNVDGW